MDYSKSLHYKWRACGNGLSTLDSSVNAILGESLEVMHTCDSESFIAEKIRPKRMGLALPSLL